MIDAGQLNRQIGQLDTYGQLDRRLCRQVNRQENRQIDKHIKALNQKGRDLPKS